MPGPPKRPMAPDFADAPASKRSRQDEVLQSEQQPTHPTITRSHTYNGVDNVYGRREYNERRRDSDAISFVRPGASAPQPKEPVNGLSQAPNGATSPTIPTALMLSDKNQLDSSCSRPSEWPAGSRTLNGANGSVTTVTDMAVDHSGSSSPSVHQPNITDPRRCSRSVEVTKLHHDKLSSEDLNVLALVEEIGSTLADDAATRALDIIAQREADSKFQAAQKELEAGAKQFSRIPGWKEKKQKALEEAQRARDEANIKVQQHSIKSKEKMKKIACQFQATLATATATPHKSFIELQEQAAVQQASNATKDKDIEKLKNEVNILKARLVDHEVNSQRIEDEAKVFREQSTEEMQRVKIDVDSATFSFAMLTREQKRIRNLEEDVANLRDDPKPATDPKVTEQLEQLKIGQSNLQSQVQTNACELTEQMKKGFEICNEKTSDLAKSLSDVQKSSNASSELEIGLDARVKKQVEESMDIFEESLTRSMAMVSKECAKNAAGEVETKLNAKMEASVINTSQRLEDVAANIKEAREALSKATKDLNEDYDHTAIQIEEFQKAYRADGKQIQNRLEILEAEILETTVPLLGNRLDALEKQSPDEPVITSSVSNTTSGSSTGEIGNTKMVDQVLTDLQAQVTTINDQQKELATKQAAQTISHTELQESLKLEGEARAKQVGAAEIKFKAIIDDISAQSILVQGFKKAVTEAHHSNQQLLSDISTLKTQFHRLDQKPSHHEKDITIIKSTLKNFANDLEVQKVALQSLEDRYSRLTTTDIARQMLDQLRAALPHGLDLTEINTRFERIDATFTVVENHYKELVAKQEISTNHIAPLEAKTVGLKESVEALYEKVEKVEKVVKAAENLPVNELSPTGNTEFTGLKKEFDNRITRLAEELKEELNSKTIKFSKQVKDYSGQNEITLKQVLRDQDRIEHLEWNVGTGPRPRSVANDAPVSIFEKLTADLSQLDEAIATLQKKTAAFSGQLEEVKRRSAKKQHVDEIRTTLGNVGNRVDKLEREARLGIAAPIRTTDLTENQKDNSRPRGNVTPAKRRVRRVIPGDESD